MLPQEYITHLIELRSRVDRGQAFHAQLLNKKDHEISLVVTYGLEDARRSLIEWGALEEDIKRIRYGYRAVLRTKLSCA